MRTAYLRRISWTALCNQRHARFERARAAVFSFALALLSQMISTQAEAACRCMALPPAQWKEKSNGIYVVKIETRTIYERFKIEGIDRDFVRHEAKFKTIQTIKGAPLPFTSLREIGQEFHCEPRLTVGAHYIVTMRETAKPEVSFCDALPADERLTRALNVK